MAKVTKFYVNIIYVLKAWTKCLKVGYGHIRVRMLPGTVIIFVTKMVGMQTWICVLKCASLRISANNGASSNIAVSLSP